MEAEVKCLNRGCHGELKTAEEGRFKCTKCGATGRVKRDKDGKAATIIYDPAGEMSPYVTREKGD